MENINHKVSKNLRNTITKELRVEIDNIINNWLYRQIDDNLGQKLYWSLCNQLENHLENDINLKTKK
jgi:hypothetical protein